MFQGKPEKELFMLFSDYHRRIIRSSSFSTNNFMRNQFRRVRYSSNIFDLKRKSKVKKLVKITRINLRKVRDV